jgi:predicted dehydrogenase
MAKPPLRVGLIGTGFMGKAHIFGYTTAARVFDLPRNIVLDTVADITDEAARAAATRYGFEKATSDWRTIIEDPNIDVVNITAPNALHKEMSMAAIAAGKHVYCEKPLAPLAIDAAEMTEAAEAAGVKTQVGFNYICNPVFGLAREMIRSGELGEIRAYRGYHAEDYMTDENAPFTFRHDPQGGGAFADLGSHTLATAEYLLGPITRVMGDTVNVIGERPDGKGSIRKVEVDDVGRAFLRFQSGATGSVEASWIATGQKMSHDFEVYGSRGGLTFSGERLNELRFYPVSAIPGRDGFRTILAGPNHPPYGEFCVAPGHQLGFNDLKAIEVAGYVGAIAGLHDEPFNFRAGWRIQSLVETVHRSSQQERWLDT